MEFDSELVFCICSVIKREGRSCQNYSDCALNLLGIRYNNSTFFFQPKYFSMGGGRVLAILRMYCIDRAGVPKSHDAQAFRCLYDQCNVYLFHLGKNIKLDS